MTRPLPQKPLTVRGKTLGGSKPLICVPLVGKTPGIIRQEASAIPSVAPDIIELRVDAWDFIEDTESSISVIEEVHETIGELPIILTCRGDWEGGFKKVSDEAKFRLYDEAVKRSLVDFIDAELAYGEQKIGEIRKNLENTSTYLIVSSHNFKETPSRDEIYSILVSQINAGAHVAKFAAMPNSEEDVLSLMSATLTVRRDYPYIPMITMSMGSIGSVSRIVGGSFGSDLTFAVGSKESAPGQIPVAELKQCLSVLFR